MATNLRRRGNSWVIHYRRDGQQHWQSFADRKYGGSKAAREKAELELANAMMRRAHGQAEPSSQRVKLDEHAEDWLAHVRTRVGAQTALNYESVARVHVLPTLGHLELRQLNRRLLDSFVSDWSEGGPWFQERVKLAGEREIERAREQNRPPRPIRLGRSPKTISNAIIVLCAMLGQAVKWDRLAANPALGLDRPSDDREHGEEMQPLDAAGVRALVEAAEGRFARALLLTAAMTGMRRGELLGLRWGDVDWNGKRIHVRRSIGLYGAVKRPKSRKSVRAIMLTPTLATELLLHRSASDFGAASDYVFPSSQGTPLDGRNMVRTIFEPTRRRAKLPRMRFHDLRHTFASLLIAQNAHPKYISEQLGHASVQITMDRYSHLFDQSYTDESAKLEGALFGVQHDEESASVLQAAGLQNGAVAFHGAKGPTQKLPALAAI